MLKLHSSIDATGKDLMSQPLQLGLGVKAAVNNQYLFSDHYLLNLLPQDPHWQASVPGLGEGVKLPDCAFSSDEAARTR